MAPANMSAEAREQLVKRFEGLVLSVYPDPGSGGAPWTAGYGHTGGDVAPGMKVTQEMADHWLSIDLAFAEKRVRALVTRAITQHEFDALVDFEYNTGHLHGSTLLKLVNAGDHDGALHEFGRWTLAQGVVLKGLVARREAEADWFDTEDGTKLA